MVEPSGVPEAVAKVLDGFVAAAREALGEDLVSVVLYGSAAEGRMRKTSDVNVIVVLRRFEGERMARLREAYRTAHAAVELEAMFLLEAEVGAAVEAFAVKFADVLHRRRVLFGPDPFAGVRPSREAQIGRLRQVLLNFVLRTRQRYLLHSLRDEQAAAIVADVAGPLRACAESLLELRGETAATPKEALEKVAAALRGDFADALRGMTQARQEALPSGVAASMVLRLIELGEAMLRQAEEMR